MVTHCAAKLYAMTKMTLEKLAMFYEEGFISRVFYLTIM